MKLLSGIIFLFAVITVYSQNNSLYIPRDIKVAYDKGTRSEDGQPGESYWQNRSEYDISVSIDPESKLLEGQANIVYYNNSPNPLTYLLIRLYQDIYKYGNRRDFNLDPESLHDGVMISRLLVNGSDLDLEESKNVSRGGTIMRVNLPDSLKSNESVEVSIDWSYKIPVKSTVRTGAYSDSSMFIAYWYPQLAVYDDIDGWDRYNYGGLHEFYNDFSDYEVSIRVPQNYLVWATGILQNPEDVLEQKYFDRYRSASESDEIVSIVKPEDLNAKITKGEGDLEWIYSAPEVPDFAFALGYGYLWDMSTAETGINNQRVIIDAAYDPDSEDFYEVADISRNAVIFFSEEMPGYPFPYPSITVFNGRGGMEFPMMVNDGSTSTRAGTVGLTTHEIAHTYFPFYTGINEKKYAWMDEGWAEFLPYEIQARLAEDNFPVERDVALYSRIAGSEIEMPLIIPSILLSERVSYRTQAYSRSSMAYLMLNELMGADKFKEALNAFIERWKGKHPIPYDFFYTFNDVYGEDLNWFWQLWFFEHGHPDLTFGDYNLSEEAKSVTIVNNGNLPVPIELKVVFEDGTEESISRPLQVWKNSPESVGIKFVSDKPVKVMELGNDRIPDTDIKNNRVEIK
jgi:hypothetical protein